MKKPSPLLVVALCGVLLAAYFAPPPSGDDVQLSEHVRVPLPQSAGGPASRTERTATRPPVTVEVMRIRPRDGSDTADASTWFPAPRPVPVKLAAPPPAPPSAPPIPPPPPQAPPLPFKALGQYTDGGQVGVFLQYRDQNLVARVGDTLAEQYKVESLADGVLTLRYLPLNQTQTLEVGAAN
jgi:hypothetical protein